ncbi:hypothetical protein Q1695_005228 [Nippostrongylus brasiliensis]|nr:hypothetical protein Q1695_005228 [Nippostrongylus brasiliensis]
MRIVVAALVVLANGVLCEDLVQLTTENVQAILGAHQLAFVTFGADWCPYSAQLKPIFAQAAARFKTENPMADVIWASVDCVAEVKYICESKFVNKYPTMKMFIFGDEMKHEYRGTRTVEALTAYISEHYKSPIKMFNNENSLLQQMDKTKRNVVGYVRRDDSTYKNLHNIALLLREYCDVWVPSEETSKSLARSRITFTSPDTKELEFTGDLQNYTYLKSWLTDKCVPIVREVTFANVEGFTEEGVPFLIYFRDAEKKHEDNIFIDAVMRELPDLRMTINPLLADGKVFQHPLRHLGKTTNDLPVLAIDSFVHMYLFPDIKKLSEPGVLRQFVLDLHSGQLHQRFHMQMPEQQQKLEQFKKQHNITADLQDRREEQAAKASPPQVTVKESVFKQLKPSEKRYSLLQKTEL